MSGDDDVVLQGAVGDLGLDKHRPPPIDKMPSMQEWGWRISTGEVVSDEQQWAARAAAAEQAAELLRKCANTVRDVVGSNYFGEGCAEGANLHEKLRSLIFGEGWLNSVARQVAGLENIATNCHSAGNTYKHVDVEEAKSIAI